MKSLVEFYLWAFHGNGIQKFSRWKSNMSQNLDFFLPKKAHIDISTKKLFSIICCQLDLNPHLFLPKNAYIRIWTHNFCQKMLTLEFDAVMIRIFGIKNTKNHFLGWPNFFRLGWVCFLDLHVAIWILDAQFILHLQLNMTTDWP